MKKSILFLAFITHCIIYAQQTFNFQYDVAGNQIERYIFYGRFASENAKVSQNDTTTLKEYDEFKYYPNPVKEELYLEWSNTENNRVQEIQLYDIQGKIMYQKNTEEVITTSIPFQALSKGVYFLQVYYTNKTQKSIKILKD